MFLLQLSRSRHHQVLPTFYKEGQGGRKLMYIMYLNLNLKAIINITCISSYQVVKANRTSSFQAAFQRPSAPVNKFTIVKMVRPGNLVFSEGQVSTTCWIPIPIGNGQQTNIWPTYLVVITMTLRLNLCLSVPFNAELQTS